MGYLLEKLSTYLAEEGGPDIFIDILPETPDKLICLREFTGFRVLQGEGAIRNVQVLVRSSADNPSWARTKAWGLYNKLKNDEHIIDSREEEEEGFWGMVVINQTPFKMGLDINNRACYGFNLTVGNNDE
jgi:hypothetical protein